MALINNKMIIKMNLFYNNQEESRISKNLKSKLRQV
jgi:hypothetical protein